MDKNRHKFLLENLELVKHPEGGYFKEIYRSKGSAKILRDGADPVLRNHSTAIFFLLKSGEKNLLHRIKSDEVWHFYEGSPLYIHEINDNGILVRNVLGPAGEGSAIPVVAIKAGSWFCAEVADENSFTLAGCTVAPGFDFEDFELADREKLIEEFPQHKDFILRFT